MDEAFFYILLPFNILPPLFVHATHTCLFIFNKTYSCVSFIYMFLSPMLAVVYMHIGLEMASYKALNSVVSTILLQKQIGCFNHSVVTLVADELKRQCIVC